MFILCLSDGGAIVPEGHIVLMYILLIQIGFRIKTFPTFFESQLKPKHRKLVENETK